MNRSIITKETLKELRKILLAEQNIQSKNEGILNSNIDSVKNDLADKDKENEQEMDM